MCTQEGLVHRRSRTPGSLACLSCADGVPALGWWGPGRDKWEQRAFERDGLSTIVVRLTAVTKRVRKHSRAAGGGGQRGMLADGGGAAAEDGKGGALEAGQEEGVVAGVHDGESDEEEEEGSEEEQGELSEDVQQAAEEAGEEATVEQQRQEQGREQRAPGGREGLSQAAQGLAELQAGAAATAAAAGARMVVEHTGLRDEQRPTEGQPPACAPPPPGTWRDRCVRGRHRPRSGGRACKHKD